MQSSLSLALGFVLVAIAACSDLTAVPVRPCPCAVGWICCPSNEVCALNQAQCPPALGTDAAQSPGAALVVAPAAARLRLGGVQSFTASMAVTWNVEPAPANSIDTGSIDPGSIDAKGTYRAPLRPGTFRVRAKTASGKEAAVTVTVGPQELSLVAGRPGGMGHADGFGSDVRFVAPRTIVGDDTYLYVSDIYSIRRIVLKTGEVTTLVADFSAAHLAIGTNGLYAAKTYGQQIHRIDPTAGTVTLVAGQTKLGNPWVDWKDGNAATAGFKQIDALAGDKTILYVNDGGLLRRVDTESGAVTTVAISAFWADKGPPTKSFPGVQIAPFDSLGPIAVLAGQLYAVETATLDQTAESIWKYDPVTGAFAQALASKVPNGPANPAFLAGAGALASLGFDDKGTPLAVKGHAVVRSVIIQGKVYHYPVAGSIAAYGDTDGLGAMARLAYPQGIWRAGVGGTDLYVADSANRQVRRIQMTTPGPVLGTEPWIVSSVAGAGEHSGSDGGIGPAARLSRPHRLVVDDQGAILVAELATVGSFYVDQIRRIDANGSTSIVTALPTTFPYVLGMAVAQGVLFVTAGLANAESKHGLLRLDAKTGLWVNLHCAQPGDRCRSRLRAVVGNPCEHATCSAHGLRMHATNEAATDNPRADRFSH